MFDRLSGWVGITDRRAGPRWSGCSQQAAPRRLAHRRADRRRRRQPGLVAQARQLSSRRTCSDRRSSVPYAELHAHSAYSFLDGASTPEELVEEAARLDLRAIALTDHDGLYGVVRFAEAAKELTCATVFGAELSLGGRRPHRGARSARAAPAGAGARAGGVSTAVAAAGDGASGRRREGQACATTSTR